MRLSHVFLSTLAATAIAGAAGAATIDVSQTQVMTTNGQDFTFNFAGLGPSDGTGGTLTIASGISQSNPGTFDGLDLDGTNEFFSVSIDGTSFGNFNCGGGTGNTVIAGNTGGIDCDFSLPLALGGVQLGQFLSNGSIDIEINFSTEVNTFSDLDELIVSLSYEEGTIAPVPLPATGLLLLGALGVMAARRRKD